MIRKRTSSFKPRLEALEVRYCLAGGGGTGVVPPGTIDYADYKIVSTPFGNIDQFSATWSMKADGSAKTALPNFSQFGEPSRQLHPDRWILDDEYVTGTYPNGYQRTELFATRLTDGAKVQLTNDPSVQPYFVGQRWAFDDSFVSFTAVTWTSVASGGNFTNAAGGQWLVAAGIFRDPVSWSSGSPVAAPAAKVLDAGLYFETTGALQSFYARADVVQLDWSPTANQVVYDQVSQASAGGAETDYLRLTTFNATGNPVGTIQLATIYNRSTKYSPEWAPDGSRIAYNHFGISTDKPYNYSGVDTIKPDGTGLFLVATSGGGGPHWSPDSQQIAFTQTTQNNIGGTRNWVEDVLRVAATGGTPVNLTKDVSDNARAVAWRSSPPALLAASTPRQTVSQTLTSADAKLLLSEAVHRWQAAGVDTSALNSVRVVIADLGDTTLGLAIGHTIYLDDNAAGWGWFVDATPHNDSEFTTPGNQGEQHRMDLLTAVMHELGHLLSHDHDKQGLMAETLAPGIRRTELEHHYIASVDQVFQQPGGSLADAWLGVWLADNVYALGTAVKRRR